jgi:3-dehydroquinate dehydratase-2
MKIAVIQGPNAQQNNVELEFFQSNLEGEIVDKIQECLGEVDGIIINPAAYSHTSIAIKDALSAVSLPVVEVHISNIYKREEFRQKSITAGASTGVISGFGPFGYHLALISLMQIVSEVKAVQEANDAKEQ